MSTPGNELQQKAGGSGPCASRANKACLPCRARKVKCDAATIGIPCSSCSSRQCAQDCHLPTRKSWTRKVIYASPKATHRQSPAYLATSSALNSDSPRRRDLSDQARHSTESPIFSPTSYAGPRQDEPELLYLNILNDAVKRIPDSARQSAISNTAFHPIPRENFIAEGCPWTGLPQLDNIDSEYLNKKGIFDLPPQHLLDILVKIYFDRVYPYSPVISRGDFIRDYESHSCSLFLLYAILTPASVHATTDVISACGFASHTDAQNSFFSKATILHDLAVRGDSILMLQGSIILCTVILDYQSDRDFGYWYHNAIGLATKLDIRNICIREDKPSKVLKLCRRIWWALYSLDIFHVSVNTQRSQILPNICAVKPRTEDDLDPEDATDTPRRLISPLTPQQRASPVTHCELSRIFGQCLDAVKNKPQQPPRQIMHPIDKWRKSLATRMHFLEDAGTDVSYLHMQAMGYRFECMLCRLIQRRWQLSQRVEYEEWPKQRFQSAVLELDSIAARVLASGNLQDFPMAFITTMTALLAMHIERALDPSESGLIHSMARISISQMMLLLTQGREIPVLSRALPVFEKIITANNLYLASHTVSRQQSVQPQSQQDGTTNSPPISHMQPGILPSQWEQVLNSQTVYGDFLGFEFPDDWTLDTWVLPADMEALSQERGE